MTHNGYKKMINNSIQSNSFYMIWGFSLGTSDNLRLHWDDFKIPFEQRSNDVAAPFIIDTTCDSHDGNVILTKALSSYNDVMRSAGREELHMSYRGGIENLVMKPCTPP